MKVTRISHIAIAGDNPEQTRILYEDILGLNSGGSEVVQQEGVTTHFYKAGESSIELLEPFSTETPVGKFLAKRGPGLHHIALEVEGLDGYVVKLKEAGIVLLSEAPSLGADRKSVV